MYIIEGNIGVGKSTFLSLLQEAFPEAHCAYEPLDNWAGQQYGQSLLSAFYADPQRWAYTLETLAMICRSRDHMHYQEKRPEVMGSKTGPVFMERSLYSGHYCFAYNGKEAGFFSELEWDIYMQWAEFIMRKKCTPPQGFIYLKANPEVCHQRVLKRQRSDESSLSIEYLAQIHERHEKFLVKKEQVSEDIALTPVLVLDCTEDFANTPRRAQELMTEVGEFIASTQRPLTSHNLFRTLQA